MIGQRLSNDDIKRVVLQRKRLQMERDQLMDGLSPESIQANPLQLMTKMPDLMKAFGLTQEVEQLSNQIVSETVLRVADSDKALGEL